jgi:signal transduction histidine kinase
MKAGVYSLALERLDAERQQAVIRLLLAITTCLVLAKFYLDQPPVSEEPLKITFRQLVFLTTVLMSYSLAMCALVCMKPQYIKTTTAVASFLEVLLITYLVYATAGTAIPFHLWYIFYVVSVATRYGWQYSVLSLSASIVGFTLVACSAPATYGTNIPAVLGFTGFLMVLAFLFGRISEKQLSYQSSLAVVNELRGELAGLASARDIIEHLLARTQELLNAEVVFFLPAKRGVEPGDVRGLAPAGADPVVVSTFRDNAGIWNVERILREQGPLYSNRLGSDDSFPAHVREKLGLRNLAAAPMMVRATPVGVIYAANRRDRPLSNSDLQLLDLIATQAAPVIENALLWERLREAAASEERLRIARDLHDNFLQNLTAIQFHLERCKILIKRNSVDQVAELIGRIHQVAIKSLAEVRAYLSELRLMGPEPGRLKEAIERLARDAAERAGFETDLDLAFPEEPLPSEIALAAFQIARELLNNAASHSRAKRVKVRAQVADGKLTIEVVDDGIGFDVARVRAEKASEGHLGLVGVEERARQYNGTFTLTSQPGNGTHAVVYLPISRVDQSAVGS